MGRSMLRLLLWPLWALQLFTGAKSFRDNPIIGSPRLNAWGLHVLRVRLARAMTVRRRAQLATAIDPVHQAQFDRDGFVEIRDFLSSDHFAALQQELGRFRAEPREMVQGHTVTRRFAVDPDALRAIPALAHFRGDARWRALARYVAGFDVEPLLYIQSILTHRRDGPPDPQIQLHADTFHPAMKAWLFLEDVTPDTGPFTYVPGSHRLTPERLAWEKRRSLTVRDEPCRLSARGSLRIEADALEGLALPQPRAFAVPANTLIVADTFGFHARGEATGRSTRVELWAYGRRNPFRPFVGLDIWSLPGIAERRIGLRWRMRDRLAQIMGQPWTLAAEKGVSDD
jgi:hypothetical protein